MQRYFRCRVHVGPAIRRAPTDEEEDRIYFQFGHGQSDESDVGTQDAIFTVTHVPAMRLRVAWMHPEVKTRSIDACTGG